MSTATQSPRFTERPGADPPGSGARPTRARLSMLALLLLATTINYVDRSNLSIVAPFLSKELGLDPVQMGLLFSAFAWSYAVANLPGGYLIDRFGSRMVYGVAQLAWSAATLMLGFVSGFGLLYSQHVQQADLGCDFDFLETVAREHRDAEPEIH